eukprot:5617558-Amphidinium_carterae.1
MPQMGGYTALPLMRCVGSKELKGWLFYPMQSLELPPSYAFLDVGWVQNHQPELTHQIQVAELPGVSTCWILGRSLDCDVMDQKVVVLLMVRPWANRCSGITGSATWSAWTLDMCLLRRMSLLMRRSPTQAEEQSH